MAVTIFSVTRLNPAPCEHYEVVADVDGRKTAVITTLSELRDVPTKENSLLLESLRYYLGNKRGDIETIKDKELLGDEPAAAKVK